MAARGRKKTTPRPGTAVRGSRTGRPIMVALDLLGRRWALRVSWELRDGPLAFRELQRRCGISSPNVLQTRLEEGLAVGILERDEAGRYGLSRQGEALGRILLDLDRWAKRWAAELD